MPAQFLDGATATDPVISIVTGIGLFCAKGIIKPEAGTRFTELVATINILLFSHKGRTMRSNNGWRTTVILAGLIVFFIGCSSDKQWKAPNLAFWKSSPFRSTPGPAPESVGAPVKPSTIAANSGAASPATARPSSGGMAPAWVSPGTPAYTASTAGVPGANAYGTSPSHDTTGSAGGVPSATVPIPPYNATIPYPSSSAGNTASPAYNNPPAYSSTSSAPQSYGGGTYPSTNSTTQSYPTYPSYPNTGSSPYGAGSTGTTSPYSPTPYGANPYRSEASSPSPGYPSTSYGMASSDAPSRSSTAPYSSSPYAPGSSGAGNTTEGTSTSDGYGASNEGYSPPRDRYSMAAAERSGTSSYDSIGLDGNRYSSVGGGYTVAPESRQVLPASATEPPPYRPGSTSDYLLRGKSSSAISTSRELGGTPSTGSNSPPYDYSQPAGSYYR